MPGRWPVRVRSSNRQASSKGRRERDLFSDHYLDNLLPQGPRWTEFFKTSEVFRDSEV